MLQLIDLAGSERLDKSGSSSSMKQLKEAQSINKSLSMLGDVIAALHRKARHIPFRNSKLTSLLRDCLGGDAKAMMVVCLSPEQAHMQESLCSLRFAQKVNACEVGRTKGGRCPLCNAQ
jgi:kinesin family protein C1